MGSFTKLKQLLEEKESFVLVCHVEPDGDAVGSLAALGRALENRGKKVTLVCRDEIPELFRFLLGRFDVFGSISDNQGDSIVLLDNGDFRRTGFCEEIKEAQARGLKVLNIDHHPKNDLWRIANINYADETASSTCEILYRLFVGLGWEITPEVATALLAGIFYDTGGFHHSNTGKAVFEVVSDLLCRGGKLKKVADKIGGNRSVPMLKLWGIALNRLRLNKAGVSVSVLTRGDIETTKATEEEISGLINLLNSAPESRIALLLHETLDGKIKGSLRTEDDAVDVAKLAKLLGGGGHKKAAGFTIDGRIEIKGKDWKVV